MLEKTLGKIIDFLFDVTVVCCCVRIFSVKLNNRCPDYPSSGLDVDLALKIVGVEGKRVNVVGSISPWVEALALAHGAASVITTDYTRTFDCSGIFLVAIPD